MAHAAAVRESEGVALAARERVAEADEADEEVEGHDQRQSDCHDEAHAQP